MLSKGEEAELRQPLISRPSNATNGGNKSSGHRCYFPARYALAVLGLVGFANVYALRVNLSVGIVAMAQAKDAEFTWSKPTQGIILSSFYYGYIFTQIPGGWLAGRIGGKMVFGVGVTVTTILTLLTPVAARAGVGWLIAVRTVEGIGEGVTFPAMHALWGRWAPPLERSRLATFTFAGPHIGTVLSMPLSGILSKYGFGAKKSHPYAYDEWPSIFYVFGCVGLLWSIVWFLLAADSPSTHPRISDEEKQYIEAAIANERPDNDNVPVPWTALLLSPALWAINISMLCTAWGFYTLLNGMPTYMQDVLNYKVEQGSFFSALPFALFAVCVPFAGRLADYLRENHLSTTTVRKIFTAVGMVMPAMFLVLTGFSTSKTAAMVFLTLGVGSASIGISGPNVNILDLSPRYSGVLMGIANLHATIPGIVAPIVAGIMAENGTAHEWRNVFIVSAEVLVFGAFFYVMFGSGEKQWWAEGDVSRQRDEENASVQERG